MQTPPGFSPYPRFQGQSIAPGIRLLPPGVHLEAIGDAWNLYSREWATWSVSALLMFVVAFFLNLAGTFGKNMVEYGTILPMNANPFDPGVFISAFLESFVTNLLYAGLFLMALKQLRGQPISVGDLFSGFRFFVPLLGVYICVALLWIIGLVALVIPSLWVSGAFVLSPLIILDQRVGVFEGMKRSFAAAGSISMAFSMFGLMFVLGLVNLLGLFACCVGILASVPVVMISLALHYYYFFPSAFQSVEQPAAPYTN